MITKIQPNLLIEPSTKAVTPKVTTSACLKESPTSSKVPLTTLQAINSISFTGKKNIVKDIELESYLKMTEDERKEMRARCARFDKNIAPQELFNPNVRYLPLTNPKEMDAFIDFSSTFNQYKDRKIICLGRSPKWSLIASSWMKDGIGLDDGYKFVAFSKHWFTQQKDYRTGDRWLERNEKLAPSKRQEQHYQLYMKKNGTDPKSIIKMAQESGKPVIITDYVESSKGFTSFLDLMSRYAKKQGVLEEFSKSIEFVTFGSNDYSDKFYTEREYRRQSRVVLPDSLKEVLPVSLWGRSYPVETYHDMPLNVFEQTMTNQNTNECRSTYYPKESWNVHEGTPCDSYFDKKGKYITVKPEFSPSMKNFRNLLNFLILDRLNARNLLKMI